VFFVTALTETSKVFPRKILLRVHGVGVDEFVDRERELVFLEMLGSFNIGPSVLALFQNGRIEQFLPSTTLKNEDIRNQEISRRIGRLMAQLYLKVSKRSTGKVIPEVWANINKWYDMSVKLTTTEDKKKAASMKS